MRNPTYYLAAFTVQTESPKLVGLSRVFLCSLVLHIAANQGHQKGRIHHDYHPYRNRFTFKVLYTGYMKRNSHNHSEQEILIQKRR